MILFERQLPSGSDEEKILGIYSTEKKAEEALARFKLKPAFKGFPDGFDMGPFTLDETYWQEGFIDIRHEDM
ncbi:MAG TPA: hypothetical protein VFC38_07065 [Stellaceae bacterium]|nr:hypothetical protein [Stellaceae bacterium]